MLIKSTGILSSSDFNGIKPTFRNKKDKLFFTFKNIGEVIQNLLDDFYKHSFNQHPFNALTQNQTEVILRDTVNFDLNFSNDL